MRHVRSRTLEISFVGHDETEVRRVVVTPECPIPAANRRQAYSAVVYRVVSADAEFVRDRIAIEAAANSWTPLFPSGTFVCPL